MKKEEFSDHSREWDTSQACRRRDSEPASSVLGRNSIRLSNRNQRSRDEAYVRALKKFNEWRHKEHTGGSLRRSTRRSNKRSATNKNQSLEISTTNSEMMKQSKLPDDDNQVDGPLYEELKSPQRLKAKAQMLDNAKKLLHKSQSFPVIGNNNYNAGVINSHDTSVEDENAVNVLISSEQCPVIDENDEDAEVMEFENNHCHTSEQIDSQNINKQQTPPRKFFRDNSNPFRGVKSPVRVTRYRLASFASPDRLFNNENISIGDFVRDSLPRDEREPERIPKSSSIQRSTYDCSPKVVYENQGKTNRTSQSPRYQRVINKHGDLVEYAIPLSEQFEDQFNKSDPLIQDQMSSIRLPSHLDLSPYQAGFQMLNSTERRKSRSLTSMNTYAEVVRRGGSTMVTDLDKSDEKAEDKFEVSDIFAELESLEKWSQRVSEEGVFKPSLSQIIKGSNLITCSTSDISQRISTLKSTVQSPIVLSSGNFRKTTVSLRKIEKRFRIQSEQGLIHELDILNKIKHPNVTLLMAVCLDGNNKILSLVLEPFVLNINSVIYETDSKINTEDCIEYILQVIKAVIYLHENGIVHSNICSHNILVCENKRVVKLSSFELATEVDSSKTKNDIINSFYDSFENFQKSILKPSLNEEGLCLLIAKNKIPSTFLPYLVEYRKLYSEHYYQPPELLSSFRQFVFPTKQADVYSISLLLWEMLNTCVPFAIFSYEEIENLFQLNDTNQLPFFDGDRCAYFETLLKSGLTTFPFKRIDNVQSMKFLIDEARVKLSKNQLKEDSKCEEMNSRNHTYRNEKNCNPAGSCDRKSYGRINIFQMTKQADDTIKLDESTTNAQKVPKSSTGTKYSSRSLDDILKADSTENTSKQQYEFQIEDFTLPSTPIARKNKLRRNAWLSNKTLNKKSFDESEEDALEVLNNRSDKDQTTFNKNKRINVNIKIIQNKITAEDEMQDTINRTVDSSLNVSSQIDYWNSIVTTPGEISLKKQNNSQSYFSTSNIEFLRTPESRIEDVRPKEQSTPTALKPAERTSLSKAMKERAKYYPNMPELLSETFLRRSSKRNADFESSLWKREKDRCEKGSPRQQHSESLNDGVERPLRTSVKETVHIFESFSKNVISSRRKSLRSKSEDILSSCCSSKNKPTTSGRAVDSIDAPVQSTSVIENPAELPRVDSTTFEDTITTTKLNVQLTNSRKHDILSKLQSSNIVSSTNEAEDMEISRLEIPPLAIYLDGASANISPLKIKPTLFSINVRKVNRRVSDIGCIRRAPKRENSLRHSICGADLLRNATKINIKTKSAENVILSGKPSKASITSLAESEIQHCKLTCWKCGSKVFKLDEIAFNDRSIRTRRFMRRFCTSPFDTSFSTAPTSSVEPPIRSTEDIYIDDDFESDGSLGANMQLLDAEQDDLLDILSIDFMPSDTFEQFE